MHTIQSTMDHELHVTIRFEDRSFWATVDEYPGVFGAGDDMEELRASLEEGIALTLAVPGAEPPKVSLAPLSARAVETVANSELVIV